MEEIRILGIAPFESIRAAMERVARDELNMLMPGEVRYLSS